MPSLTAFHQDSSVCSTMVRTSPSTKGISWSEEPVYEYSALAWTTKETESEVARKVSL